MKNLKFAHFFTFYVNFCNKMFINAKVLKKNADIYITGEDK